MIRVKLILKGFDFKAPEFLSVLYIYIKPKIIDKKFRCLCSETVIISHYLHPTL